MKITMTIELEIKHTAGKFASKLELAEKIAELLNDNIVGETIYTDEDAEYTVEEIN